MEKKQKKRLKMADGYDVKDISELQSHADMSSILHYYRTGELRQWLQERYYDDEADKLNFLQEDEKDFPQKLCEIIGIPYHPVQLENSLPSKKFEYDCESHEDIVSHANMKNHDLITEVQNSMLDFPSKECPNDTENVKFYHAATVVPDIGNTTEENNATNQITATSQASTDKILKMNLPTDELDPSPRSEKLDDTHIQTNELTSHTTLQDHNQDMQSQDSPAIHAGSEVSKIDDTETIQKNPSHVKEQVAPPKTFVSDSSPSRTSILDFFSTKKRLNRKKYMLRLLMLCAFLIAIIIVSAITDVQQIPALTLLTLVTGSIIFWISFFMATICRLHDLGHSGWWCVILFVPYVNIALAIYLILFKGTNGSNKYGNDPLAMNTESN